MKSITENQKIKVFLILIVLLGAFLRMWGINWGLPFEYQSEEYKVIKYALRMGGGDLNPHSFEYPSLYYYFILFVYGCYFLLGKFLGSFQSVNDFAQLFVKNPTNFYLIGRSLETLFGVGIIILTYQIGKKIFSINVGIISAFIMAILPSAINTGHVTKGDSAAIFLGLLFWLCTYKIYETGEKKYYCLSGLLLGIAISTKYYMAMMGINLLLAHFLRDRRSISNLILSLVLIPLLFVIGSPYSVLSYPEFLKFFTDQRNSFVKFSGTSMNYVQRALFAMQRLLNMSDLKRNFILGSYGFGFLSLTGAIYLGWSKKKETLLLIVPIFIYFLVVSTFYHPAAGYLAPIFPLFAICGSYLVCDVYKKMHWMRWVIFTFFLLAISSSFGESVMISYSYTLQDTRTIAKNWINSNISKGSKVLMDQLVSSPPLEMSEKQLKRFYDIAIKSNHYKKEFFRLKLEILDSTKKSYEIFLIKRSASEIGSLKHQVEEVQKVQDFVEIRGDKNDLENLKRIGIQYVIVNSIAKKNAMDSIPWLANFYSHLPGYAQLVKTFEPESSLHPGPIIQIYKLL
ncbi:MAG: glycosyltransferase family 39 protein [Elusimicrobia bacterium]|nr:glycosyltransferase family 39 protein [Elusimicrobiota bacterium]